MAVLITLFLFITSIFLTIYFYIKYKYNYWNKKKVPHIKPTILFGNFKEWILQKEYIGISVQKICNQFPNEPYVGAYLGPQPVFIAKDPEIVKLVTITEFSNFSSRELKDYVHKETFGRSLINSYGEDWKFTRSNISPMFSTMKLKSMFPLIEDCANDFEKYLDKEILGKSIEAREFLTSYTMASFVSCAFGIDLKNFGEANVFQTMGKMFFEYNPLRGFIMVLQAVWPSLFYALGLRRLPEDMTIFFSNLLKDVFASRNYKPSARKDFVDSFLHLKETAEKQFGNIDDEYIVAQSIAIFAGGFETSAMTVSFMLYELAKHGDMQEKVHKEIDDYLNKTDGKITFDCITELPYLNACMDETMRLYPIVGVLTREVTKDFTLPSGAVLEKGVRIYLPTYYLHHNPDYFPQPEDFRPERFYGETKQEIKACTYIPFGEGPRFCIGKRFAKLQSFIGVITILRNRKVLLADGMTTKLTFEPNSPTTQIKGGIFLKFSHRNSKN